MIINDNVFGELEYITNWEKTYSINIFSKIVEVLLSVEGEGNTKIEEYQKKSFLEFEKNTNSIILDVEYKLFEYYINNYISFRERVDEKYWSNKVPSINTKEELGAFVEPYMIRFPCTFGKDIKLYGILFDCPWDDEAGVAVKFEDGNIEVGSDEILLM